MTSARNYDVILTLDSNVSSFTAGNTVIGVSSLTEGFIANVDTDNSQIKVKLNNLQQEFRTEQIFSNSLTLSTSANGALNSASIPFQSNTRSGEVTVAQASITATAPSTFIAEKNAFTQNPVVRLFEVYYPGEWYPPNAAGNPTLGGAGRAWPNDFPIKFADIRGDLFSDITYNVTYGGENYIPFPANLSDIEQASDGKISDVTVSIFNVDNILSVLLEDPYLVGNCTTNSVVAHVNGEAVHGIDPRTVNANPADVGSVGDEAFDSLTRARANGLAYSSTIQSQYGRANASFTKTQCESINGTWQEQKPDTRDLLGGVVNIKTTFANFLDTWPEYSTVKFVTSNVVEVYNAMPYRVNDNVRSSKGTIEATIQSIQENRFLFLSNPINADTAIGDPIFIVNSQADPESYIEDTFKIDQLESMNDEVVSFGLTSWLQYFKQSVPKRKYYKNVCQWTYKGDECQYPGPGGLAIPGTDATSNANPIAANNEIAATAGGDICGKSIQACTLRNNQHHFGGFPATGRTVPKQ